MLPSLHAYTCSLTRPWHCVYVYVRLCVRTYVRTYVCVSYTFAHTSEAPTRRRFPPATPHVSELVYTQNHSHTQTHTRIHTQKCMHCLSQRRAWREWVAICCSVLQHIAKCCSVLQVVAVYCSVLQCVAEFFTHDIIHKTMDVHKHTQTNALSLLHTQAHILAFARTRLLLQSQSQLHAHT